MPSKKPSPANQSKSPVASLTNSPGHSPAGLPSRAKKGGALAENALKKPDNRWQRTKRYGWDSR